MVRAFRPAARAVRVRTADGARAELARRRHRGRVRGHGRRRASCRSTTSSRSTTARTATFTVGDPYRFLPTLGDMDLHLVGEGRHEELYAKLGAHVIEHQGVHGHRVRGLGAERALGLGRRRLQLVGRAAAPDALARLERHLGAVPARRRRGRQLQVRDPHAGGRDPAQGRPGRVRHRAAAADRLGRPRVRSYEWDDADVARAARRRRRSSTQPISIYEVHLGSWRLNPLEGNRSLTYLELADELAAYAKRHGLHPHRAAAGDGAPVQRLVGLPGDGLLRPDAALRHARRASARSSTGCTSTGSA